jgi:hypothetical protein
MGPLEQTLSGVSAGIEASLRLAAWFGTLSGWLLWSGAGLLARRAAWRRSSQAQRMSASRPAAQIAGVLLAAAIAAPPLAGAQGWWSGRTNPGFDQNTVIQVAGTVAGVSIAVRGAPSTLRLDAGQESYLVMLGPGWYLAELHVDIREGDPMVVEGSKMMDRGGDLHLVAARVTNRRTGNVLELRDHMGRPCWTLGRPTGR